MAMLSTSYATGFELSLCGEEGIKFNGQTFVPNPTLGYFQFAFSHAFPVYNVYQTGVVPAVVANSHRTLLNQNLNYEHQIALYHPDREVRDRVIGSIVAVDFPKEPFGGWKITTNAEQAPGITGVASVFKSTQGMARILGEHLSGRRQYTVSMEVLWPLDESGFAVALNGKDPQFDYSPPDFLAAGWEYIPFEKAPDMLRSTFSQKKGQVVAQYKGRKVVALMGGLSSPVHYQGAGLVQFGAEPPAKIMRMAASQEPLNALAEGLLSVFRGTTQNPTSRNL